MADCRPARWLGGVAVPCGWYDGGAAMAALEGGLYALALCPFGHITNAGLATNHDFVQPSFVTINARRRNLSKPAIQSHSMMRGNYQIWRKDRDGAKMF